MRIHADITNATAAAISDIKQLLISHFGERFNDTGHVIGYMANCTVQSLNEHYAKQAAELANLKKEMVDDKIPVGEIPTPVQDTQIGRSGPASNPDSSNPAENNGPAPDRTVD